jgi:long-chain fatty acid transport protein
MLDFAVEYIDFERSTLDRERFAFEGTPVLTRIQTDGTATGQAVTLGIGARFAL